MALVRGETRLSCEKPSGGHVSSLPQIAKVGKEASLYTSSQPKSEVSVTHELCIAAATSGCLNNYRVGAWSKFSDCFESMSSIHVQSSFDEARTL